LVEQEAAYRLQLEHDVKARKKELTQANLRLEAQIVQRLRANKSLADKASQNAIASERTRLARDLVPELKVIVINTCPESQ
jgi:C4-dicarboxylate-specific signal transduction histidine kinase